MQIETFLISPRIRLGAGRKNQIDQLGVCPLPAAHAQRIWILHDHQFLAGEYNHVMAARSP